MSAPESAPAPETVTGSTEVMDEKPCDLATLKTFEFDRVLSEGMSASSLGESGAIPSYGHQRFFDPRSDQCDGSLGSFYGCHEKLTPGPTSAYLYGTLHGEPAIIHVARTSLDTSRAPQLVKEGLENLDVFLDNRPVSTPGRSMPFPQAPKGRPPVSTPSGVWCCA